MRRRRDEIWIAIDWFISYELLCCCRLLLTHYCTCPLWELSFDDFWFGGSFWVQLQHSDKRSWLGFSFRSAFIPNYKGVISITYLGHTISIFFSSGFLISAYFCPYLHFFNHAVNLEPFSYLHRPPVLPAGSGQLWLAISPLMPLLPVVMKLIRWKFLTP